MLVVKQSGQMPEAKLLGCIHVPAGSNPVQSSCIAHLLSPCNSNCRFPSQILDISFVGHNQHLQKEKRKIKTRRE